jgi:ABC-type antimicrobial peptide transport system permease subunit
VSVRNGRVDLTVARVLGFSRRQMLLSLTLERVVVTVLGLVVGSVIGYLLSRWVLGFLDTTPGGQPIIPPVVFTPQSWIIALTLLCLITAALLAIAFAALSASRLRASDILRTGE